MIVVSACMAGLAVRYDGNSARVEGIARLVREGKAVLVCPEQLGGFLRLGLQQKFKMEMAMMC